MIDLFMFWCIAMLLMDSQGKTRMLGAVAMSIVVGVKADSYGLAYLGTSLNAKAPGLKVLFLLPFAWLLFETRKTLLLRTTAA